MRNCFLQEKPRSVESGELENSLSRVLTLHHATTATSLAEEIIHRLRRRSSMSGKGNTSSESTLFSEHGQARHCIDVLTDETLSKSQGAAALSQLRGIFDKYLECPTLLDSHLEEMITSLAEAARLHLMSENTPYILSALYALSKVRGRKRIQRFLPHETRDVEPVFAALQKLENNDSPSSSSEMTGPQTWESVYVLWIWLDMLSLVPFDCLVLSDDSLVPSIVILAKSHLSHAGPTRETAASCLASWLSRRDMSGELDSFIQWSHGVLVEFQQTPRNVVLVMGVLQTLAKLVKTTTNQTHVGMEPLWEPVLAMAETQSTMLLRKLFVKWFSRMGCAYLPARVASWRYQRGRRSLWENLESTRTRKSAPVIESTAADTDELFHVPDQVEDAMGLVLQSLTDSSTVVRWSAAKGVGRMTERLPAMCADDVLDFILELCRDPEKDHAWHGACLALAELARRGLLLPARLGDVVPLVVKAIQFDVQRGQSSVGAHVRDAACYTFWAFARAYAPSILRPYVPELSRSIVVASLFDREVNCRRAASAAFQECVGRQGADNFMHGISILTAADYISLGNVNNAFTTVAFHVAQYPEYRYHIIDHLYKTKLRHWDISIRTLASKSLHGITSLDPDHMRKSVLPYLVERSMNENLFVRHGAVLGLAEVVLALEESSDDSNGTFDEFDKEALDSVVELVARIEKARLYRGRGGEIMRSAVCRLIECISQARLPLTVKQQVRFLDSVDACLKHPNEDIQEAASKALFFLMRNYFPVRESGPSDRLQKRVVGNYVNIVNTSVNPAETRGFALALGSLPDKLLAPSFVVLSSVLDCLFKTTRYDAKVGEEADAETRRNAVLSLTRICGTVGVGRGSNDSVYPTVTLTSEMAGKIFDAFSLSLEDYYIDRRGDVGSWSRIAAMSGLESMTYAAVSYLTFESNGDTIVSSDRPWFDQSMCIRVIGGLLKQFSEKLDSVRSHAGECLSRILTCTSPAIPFVPQKDHLLESLQLTPHADGSLKIINWANAAVTYRMAMAAADINEFFPFIISGMIISVGGLGESVTKSSEEALLSWVRTGPRVGPDSRAALLAYELLRLFMCHQRNRRIVLPLLKTLDMLINRGCLNDLIHINESAFSASLLDCLTTEAKRCTDVHTLLAIVNVSLGMLSSQHVQTLNEEILMFICRMLGHRFPRVRRFTADHLYVRLLEENDIVCNQGALELLLEAPWDADMNLNETRELSGRFAEMIGITLLWEKQSSEATKKDRTVDEFASYASLVNSA